MQDLIDTLAREAGERLDAIARLTKCVVVSAAVPSVHRESEAMARAAARKWTVELRDMHDAWALAKWAEKENTEK